VVAVQLPESGRIHVEELEGAESLRTLPEVELGDDETDWAAVLGFERIAVVLHREQHIVVDELVEREVRRVVRAACTKTYFASGFGRTRATISRMGTPSKRLSRRDQRVTQWISHATSVMGRRRNSSHVHDTSFSTSPKQRNVQVCGSKRGVAPYVSTGHFVVNLCLGGTRAATFGSTAFVGWAFSAESTWSSGIVGSLWV
jgi:hypothetical protein